MADGQEIAIDAILVLNDVCGTIQKPLSGRTFPKDGGKACVFENGAETVFRVTGNPAVTLGQVAFGMDADKMIRTIAVPDAGQQMRLIQEAGE